MRFELLLVVLIAAIHGISIVNDPVPAFKYFTINDQESELATTGKLCLIESQAFDFLLIPGVGDYLAQNIFEKRFELKRASYLVEMSDALQHVKGVGIVNSKKFGRYLR